jgi:CubicO group peptidase (beta-lactamase class C family)
LFSDTPVDRLYRENKVLDQTRPLDELISSLADIPLLYQPGTRYHYSVAVDVQGYLIEKLSGMPLEDFVRERVLAPLNMDETMSWVPPELAARLSKIHAPGEDGVLGVYQPGESGFDPDIALTKPVFFSGGAQLISTADDYWRFGQMLLNGGVLDGVRVLSPASVKMMTSNRLPAAVPDRESGTGWGHGFNLQVATDATRINYPVNNGEFRHGGVATTIFWADPELELVVVMLSQYLPYSNPFYYDHVHRWVLPAIID